uniref:Uncharacterized protein n=1 Tax=Cacopsylla melanoneura TaxID=428564 RepID=A0A8D9BF29_9HEMI
MTGNYPYCLTASKDNKSPTTHEKSEILKKSFPFTYLEIMGNTPHDSIHVGNEVKANQWSARNDPEIGLVEKDNELASDNDYSNTIGYNSLEMTNNWNKDLVQNNFVTNSPLKAIKNDMEVSHNFPANNDFEPTNNIAMRHLRTNNQLNNMERNNDLEMVNKIGTDNKQMFHIGIQTHDNHPSIQYGEDLTESSGHTRNDMNGINRKSVRRNTNMVQAHHKMIDNMPNVNIHNYNAPSNSLTRPGENMQSDIRTDKAKSDNVLDNVRGKNIQSEKMLRDANIPNVYYQTHTVRSGNIESDNGQNGNVQNGNIHINNIHSNDIRSDNMLNDNVDENMQDNASSHSMLNDIIDIQTNMLSPSGDLLVSNDVAQVLQGKTNSLTDEFIGVDERLVNNESNEKHYAKHNGGNIGKEKGTLKGFANSKKKADKNLLKKTVVDEVEKEVCEKELNKKENARVKDVRKLIDGTEHKKITGNGKAKKVKLLKHLSPPIAGSKLRRQGKSKSLQVDNLVSFKMKFFTYLSNHGHLYFPVTTFFYEYFSVQKRTSRRLILITTTKVVAGHPG